MLSHIKNLEDVENHYWERGDGVRGEDKLDRRRDAPGISLSSEMLLANQYVSHLDKQVYGVMEDPHDAVSSVVEMCWRNFIDSMRAAGAGGLLNPSLNADFIIETKAMFLHALVEQTYVRNL